MMKGLNTFAEYFEEFNDQYVVIGGAACDDHFREAGLEFRVTNDIDLILVVEALNDTFIEHFWQFIKEGKYTKKEVSEDQNYYRFTKPEEDTFPAQLELLSLTPDAIKEKDDMHLTPIPADGDLSSLSAILMDKNYYEFTMEHSVKMGPLHRADDIALICLKAKAFLNLSEYKADGGHVNSDDIKKHKNDVFRLAATLPGDKQIELPKDIQNDIKSFIDEMEANPPNAKQFLELMGITTLDTEDLIEQLRETFNLH